MNCPYCGKEMTVGSISQCKFALKWVSKEDDKGALNHTPLVKGIVMTSEWTGDTEVKVFYCPDCRKFVIDQDDMHFYRRF